MYQQLKNIVKQLVPSKWLFQLEPLLRMFYALFYRGHRHQCPVCQTKLSKFILLPSGDRLCPRCASIDRNRRLWLVLQEQKLAEGKLLHFSPPRPLYRQFKRKQGLKYYASDFVDEFVADFKYDIRNIPQPDNSFDTIICFHVLEHVLEDQQAMKELYRVCKPQGQVIIQTPFKEGDIYEDYSITSPQDRLAHFGQEDHVRVYSVSGLINRLEKAGFQINSLQFDSQSPSYQYHGLKAKETILLARK